MPTTAILYEQLTPKNDGPAVPTSGHVVTKVMLKEDNQDKLAFFKPLDETYPELLAKYVVAISVLLRSVVGDIVDDNRLVFKEFDIIDKEGKVEKSSVIVGTLSIAIEGYKPLQCVGETDFTDLESKEQGNPSVQTLLKSNMIRLLVARWRIKDDDAHPGNLGFSKTIDEFMEKLVAVGIDWDMALYTITSILKGGRWIDGLLKPIPIKALTLKSTDIDNFPNVDGRTHWPPQFPLNLNRAKKFKSSDAFATLATNPKINGQSEIASAQTQFFTALLEEVLLFQPTTLEARLKEALGELPLDYKETDRFKNIKLSSPKSAEEKPRLSSQKITELEKDFPQLFNDQSNQSSFVDHIVKVFQSEYDELYRTVVFYTGCEKNNSDVSVPSFREFLRNNPDAYHQIISRVESENKQSHYPYDMDLLEKRYHQIWRNAFLYNKPLKSESRESSNNNDSDMGILDISAQFESLIEDLVMALNEKPSFQSLPAAETIRYDDPDLHDAIKIIEQLRTLPALSVNCDETNPVGLGLKSINEFYGEWVLLLKAYYQHPYESLTAQVNQQFIDNVSALIANRKSATLSNLASTSWRTLFVGICQALENIKIKINFADHLVQSHGCVLSISKEQVTWIQLQQTDVKVMDACYAALMNWVDEQSLDEFNKLIQQIIDKEYAPASFNVLSSKERAEPVKSYLQYTKESNQAKLNYILSWGGTESNSLNTLIVQKLVGNMMSVMMKKPQYDLRAVKDVLDKQIFDASCYATQFQKKANEHSSFLNSPFTPLSSAVVKSGAAEKFYDCLYQWINMIKPDSFLKIVTKAKSKYDADTRYTLWAANHKEVIEYFNNSWQNSKILGYIFTAKSETLNPILLDYLLLEMKGSISRTPSLLLTYPSFKYIAEINMITHKDSLLKAMKESAKPHTFDGDRLTVLKNVNCN